MTAAEPLTDCVVDSSVLIRLFIPDGPLPDRCEEIIDAAWRGAIVLHAPELALAEVGGVLRKKEAAGLLSAEEVDDVLAEVLRLPIRAAGHGPLMAGAIAASRHHGLTVYDGLFLTLARRLGARLLTADAALAAAAG